MIIRSKTVAVCDRCDLHQTVETDMPGLAMNMVCAEGWARLNDPPATDRQALLCPGCFTIVHDQIYLLQKG